MKQVGGRWLMRSPNSYIILAAILNYVVDGYGHYSASALGGVVFIRNIVSRLSTLHSLATVLIYFLSYRSAPFSLCVSIPVLHVIQYKHGLSS